MVTTTSMYAMVTSTCSLTHTCYEPWSELLRRHPPVASAPASRALAKPLSAGLTNHSCLKATSSAVIASCGPWNDYSLKYVRVLAELCEAGNEAAEITAAASRVCGHASDHDRLPASQEHPSGFEIAAATVMQG